MQKTWWKESVVYQIYPQSFCDSDGDGVGDLRGIIQKLDYLKELGIDVVWLSPVYQSPNHDMGYDISDYQAIMDRFGTLADWEEMVAGMHARGIKLVMDLVVNHTSDEHPWFVEARKSKDNPYRDYYIWRQGDEGHEPNNWRGFFGGSVWTYDELTGEYYLHLFSEKQPDLNWENPKVRQAVYDMMRWWLDKGVDGFRMDVINLISKVSGLPSAPITSTYRYQWGGQYFLHGPRFMEFLREMRQQVLDDYNTLTVGEAIAATPAQAIELTHPETGPLSMIFHFEHMQLDEEPGAPMGWGWRHWSLLELKQIMTRWQKELEGKGWNSQYLSNHDQPRQVSRFGDEGQYRVESAKMLATFLHLLQGTPYIYQGEEIGMTNVIFPSIEDYRDIATRNRYREMLEEEGVDRQAAMELVHRKSRDNARTPMQWDDSPNAGFSTGTPWIKVNPNYKEINVAHALSDPESIFYYYQRLIQLRKTNPVIVEGRYDLILEDDPEIYAFTRTLEGDRLLVILNFTANTPIFRLPKDLSANSPTLLIANYSVDETEAIQELTLRPFEARVYRL
ncbi:alpha-glucosidase [Leptolyngbya sp. FACHB-16]|uniref:glycoside hydrolase family 13 protein n=1 Tax=unclassified Leptolyngbya TaxID=2650499 RepID=UPI001687EAEA|nr:alpha-glucosidase [Leptolyngbya sp. FACHB-16]MBD2156154.1 alpha-glucosidase [Leptolyngbya sp. FACHB-16]